MGRARRCDMAAAKPTKKTPKTTQQFVDYRITEVEEAVENTRTDLSSKIGAIHDKLDKTFASRDYVDDKVNKLDERLASLESDRQWFIRAVLGIIIVAVMGLVVTKGGL